MCTKLIGNKRFIVNTYLPHRSFPFLASILQHHTYDKQALLIPLLASLELYKRQNNSIKSPIITMSVTIRIES